MLQPHTKSRTNGLQLRATLTIICACFCLALAAPAHATVSSFDVKVPHKNDGTHQEIFLVKITVSLATLPGAPFSLTLTRADGPTRTIPELSAIGGHTSEFGIDGTEDPTATPPIPKDTMRIILAPSVADSDPLKRKYVIMLTLSSNIDLNCTSRLPEVPPASDETWTVTGTIGGAPIQFDGACAQSLDKNGGGGVCSPMLRSVPPNDAGAPASSIAIITGPNTSNLGCRPGVDCVLVLDRSGSMNERALGGTDPLTKITALKSAVGNFMDAWTALRANEATSMIRSPDDRVGVVFFNNSNPARWLREIAGGTLTAGMDSLSTVGVPAQIASLTNAVPATGGTSIGSGLRLADGAFIANGNRKVIVVMTDGMENSPPLSRSSPLPIPTNVQTTDPGGTFRNLNNQPPAQIYGITIGASGTINATVNENMAKASGGGFYLNTEHDATLLTNFFTEVLQNFIKFSTVETYRLVSKQTPFTTSLPVTTTTTALTFTLTWNGTRGPLKLTVTPPNGGTIVRRVVASDAPGSMLLNIPLPSRGIPAAGGNWGISIEADSINGLPPTGPAAIVPFSFIVLGDDTAVNSDLTTIAADYAPGDQIRLSATITELGEPVTGATVVADLIRPDAGGIGDLLSSSTASTSQPASPDQLSPADAKLRNTLAADPNAIKRAESAVTLFDNGSAANGDATAGDGVYSALFPAQLIGHYNFTIGAVGSTRRAGTFSRQQLRTVHVRAVPDVSRTTASATIQTDKGSALVVNLTPLTKFGNHLGPGWGNYLWVTGNGITPTKFGDNMNGTYTASIPLTGIPPIDVDIHFERVNERIPDDARPDQLPVALGNSTVVVPHVKVGGSGGFRHWGLSLHAGVSIPHGNLNNVFNPGPNFAFDLEYRFNRRFSLEGIYGYHRFRGETFGPFTLSDLNVHQFSVNGKVYGTSSPVRPFFNFGGGAYVFTPGVSTHGGLNIGGGVQFDVTPNFAVEGVYNFHNVFTSGSNTRFSGVQGGVRFRF